MSARRPWFKCFPTDMLGGAADLSDAEKGAYYTLLLLMYDQGGSVRDDAVSIAPRIRCSRRRWARHRAVLLDMGKIVLLPGGRLTNPRVCRELSAVGELPVELQPTATGEKACENAAKTTRKRAENASKTRRKLIEKITLPNEIKPSTYKTRNALARDRGLDARLQTESKGDTTGVVSIDDARRAHIRPVPNVAAEAAEQAKQPAQSSLALRLAPFGVVDGGAGKPAAVIPEPASVVTEVEAPPVPAAKPRVRKPRPSRAVASESGLKSVLDLPEDLRAAVELWQELARDFGLQRLALFGADRERKLRRRFDGLGGMEGWRAAMDKLRESPAALGENTRGWKIDFDYLLVEGNLIRMIEGYFVEPWATRRGAAEGKYDWQIADARQARAGASS